MSVQPVMLPRRTALLTTSAFAKVNLTLDVLGARDDGFHEIRSVVSGVDLADRLEVRATSGSDVRLHCTDRTIEHADNLVLQAARRLAAMCPRPLGADIALSKRIPVGGGLGGGSSDAAFALCLLNRVWALDLSVTALAQVGAGVGSDVPLFFSLPCAFVSGRGTDVKPVTLAWHGWVVLVFAGVSVSTASVYGAWRPSDGAGRRTDASEAVITARSASELGALCFNHLEPAVFRVSPPVRRVHEALVGIGAGPVRVSGAGSAMYMLFDDRETATDIASRIRGKAIGSKVWVLRAPAGDRRSDGEEA